MMSDAELLRSVANDIERQGHFQPLQHPYQTHYSSTYNPDGPCCLIINPTVRSDPYGRNRYRLIGLLPEAQRLLGAFSDHTPTDELLALLRRRADEVEEGHR